MLPRTATKVQASADAAEFLHTEITIEEDNNTRGCTNGPKEMTMLLNHSKYCSFHESIRFASSRSRYLASNWTVLRPKRGETNHFFTRLVNTDHIHCTSLWTLCALNISKEFSNSFRTQSTPEADGDSNQQPPSRIDTIFSFKEMFSRWQLLSTVR